MPIADTRVLVTGGLGFIGSNLAHTLSRLGASVTAYDACLDPYGWNPRNIEGAQNGIGFVKGDVRDERKLCDTLKQGEFDSVFHCAAQVSHLDSMSDPFLDVDINCTGTLRLLEAMRKHAGDAKLVYVGTRAQAGRQHFSPMTEEHPDDPADVYGANKLAAEKYALIYGKAYGTPACSLRLTNCYGPRHQMKHAKYGILNWVVRQAMLGGTVDVYGDGSQLRDYCYVQDACDALVLAMQDKAANGEVFLVGTGKGIRFVDMVKAVIAAAGSGSYRNVEWPQTRKAIETGDAVLSYGKIRARLGWEPRTPLDEGLKKTVEFYKDRLEKYT